MENSLPTNWVEVQLEELLVSLESGSRPKGGVRGIAEGVPSVGGEHLNDDGGFNFTNIKFVPKSFASKMNRGKINSHDVLIVKDGATTGKTSFINGSFPFDEAVVNEHVFICRASAEFNPKFLFYFLWSKEGKEKILENFKGSAQGGINTTFASNLLVPVSPLAEQHRIVAKLDSLFAKTESNKQRLEKIPQLLKRFRQSVLAAAVSGNNGIEEIANNVCSEIQIGPFGTQLHKHDYISKGIPLVNPTHIQAGEIVPDMDLTISKTKFKELSNYHLQTGDVIMGRRGEMARCALVGKKENGWLCGTGSLFFRPDLKKVNPQYLFWVLSNNNTKAFLEGEAKGSTMSNLNLNIVRNIPIPLPPLEEQKEIVKQVEQLFAFADKIENRYTKAKTMIDKLPQSILAKAFRGELVSQNADDEPASMLLERIALERARTKVRVTKRTEAQVMQRTKVRSTSVTRTSVREKVIRTLVRRNITQTSIRKKRKQ